MRAEDIAGQKELKEVFSSLIEESRLPHAMLIHGSEDGQGLPLALFLTQLLLCENRQGAHACGVCPNCQKMAALTHPDVHFVFPVNSNKSVKKAEDVITDSFLDGLRNAVGENPHLSLTDWYQAIGVENKQGFLGKWESSSIRKKLALRAYEGGYRVFVLWHADRMNIEFGNKILKSLEEPSEKVLFLLITEAPSKLLSTIRSRVQLFQEEPLELDELTKFLSQRYELSIEEAKNIAFRSEGSMGLAISEIKNHGDPWLHDFRDWMRMAYARDMIGLYQWSEMMAKKTRDEERQFVSGALRVIDRSFRMGWLDMDIPLEGDEADFYRKFAPFINTANAPQMMAALEEAAFHIERNVNEKLVWYDTSIKVVRFIHEGKKAVKQAS